MTAHPTLPLSPEDLQAAARYRLARFHQLSREDREDLTQEAVLRALLRSSSSPSGLASRAAHRLAIDLLRRQRTNDRRAAMWEESRPMADLFERVNVAHDAARARLLASTAPAAHADGVASLVLDAPAPACARQRDAFYKRRWRAAAWLRSALEGV